jgi:peptidyl-prolyl cis-trans isomerase A (cyclophilin A)
MTKYATIQTNKGDIRIKLLEDEAPETVGNFVGLATGTKEYKDPNDGQMKTGNYYDGTVFHRVIPNFMIQGGDPTGTGRGGPGYEFGDEFKGGRKFDRAGYLAMANAGPGTNGSQFFITVAPTPHLTGRHTIFGLVESGQEVANDISEVESDRSDRPNMDVVIKGITIEEE